MITQSLLLSAFVISFQDGEKWEVVVSKEGGYAVEMPSVPQQEGTTPFVGPGGSGTLDETMRQADDATYDLKRYVSQRSISEADGRRWLDFGRDKEAGIGAHGKLVSEKEFRLGAVVGREFVFLDEQLGGSRFEARGRAYVKGSTLYVLLASASKGNQPLPPGATRFLESFAFGTKPNAAGKAVADKVGVDTPKMGAWKVVTLEKDKATVEMPSEPSQKFLGGNLDPPLDGYFNISMIAETPTADYEGVIFRNEKGRPISDRAKALVVARERAVSQFGTETKVLSDGPARSGAGSEFEVAIDRDRSGVVNARGRALIEGDVIYLLLAVAKAKGKPLPPEAGRFLDSLVVTGTGTGGPSSPKPDVFKGWGKPVDPDGDVAFTPSARSLTLVIPGKPHVLAPERDTMNAPRVLAPVRGDFVATVRVDGTFQPGRESTVKGLSARQAGGLLIWKDPENYLVLQRRSAMDDGKLVNQVVLEELVAGSKGVTHRQPIADGPIVLRLVRTRGRIAASYSNDGKTWKDLKPVDTTWAAGPAEVGTVAVSTSTSAHSVTFNGFTLKGR